MYLLSMPGLEGGDGAWLSDLFVVSASFSVARIFLKQINKSIFNSKFLFGSVVNIKDPCFFVDHQTGCLYL